MERKRLLIPAGIAAMAVPLICITAMVIIILRLRSTESDQVVTEIAYCDVNSEKLCIVSFGADENNNMLINFMLPDPSLPPFYAQVRHADTINKYECQAVEGFPNSIYCKGPRTPLGEAIAIEVYSTEDDTLLAKGSFIVAAIALPTVRVVSSTPGGPTATPDLATRTRTPTPTITPLRTVTLTPTRRATPSATRTPIPYPP